MTAMTREDEDALILAVARHLGLDIALNDHRAELLAAGRRAFALRAAIAHPLPPEAEPAPSLRMEAVR